MVKRFWSNMFSQGNLFDSEPVPEVLALPQKVVKLGPTLLKYRLKRSHRRSIGLQIDEYGLRVSAPGYATMMQIESVLFSKSDWILKKLSAWQKRQTQNVEPERLMQEGAWIPVLGQMYQLKLDEQANRLVHWDRQEQVLVIKASQDQTDLIERRLNLWLRQQARNEFERRIVELLPRLNVTLNDWALSSASTRWGVCTADKNIRLNWRLVHYPDHVIDYVVSHELAHLVEMNHSDRFWNKVAMLCPNYESAKQLLSSYHPQKIPVFS